MNTTPRTAIRLALLALLVSLAPAPASAQDREAGQQATVVYLLRHAETVPPPYEETPPDPPLSEAGLARAAHLAHMLIRAGVTHLFSSDYRRTRQTVQPLAEALGLEVRLYDPRTLEAFAERLRRTPGRHVVAGHSNTTPALVALLGGDPGDPIDDGTEFDRLYILILDPDGRTTTLHHRY